MTEVPIHYLLIGGAHEHDRVELARLIKEADGNIDTFRDLYRTRFKMEAVLFTESDRLFQRSEPEKRIAINE